MFGWGLLDEAIADYTKAIELDPAYADAYYNRGLAYFGSTFESGIDVHELVQAKQDFDKAIELDPFYVTLNFYAGWAYFLAGEFDLMFATGERMLELEPPWHGHCFMGYKPHSFN